MGPGPARRFLRSSGSPGRLVFCDDASEAIRTPADASSAAIRRRRAVGPPARDSTPFPQASRVGTRMRSRHRLRHLSAGPSTRRHRRASRRVVLTLDWLEVRWVPTTLGPLGGVTLPPPIITAPPAIDRITNTSPVPAGTPVTLTVAAHDPEGLTGPLTYEFDFQDDGIFDVTNATGVASWTYDNPGLHVVDVRVVDALGDKTDALTFVIVTTPARRSAPRRPAGRRGHGDGVRAGPVLPARRDRPVERDDRLGRRYAGSTFTATAAGDLGSLPHTYSRYGELPCVRPGERRPADGPGHLHRRRGRRHADRDGPARSDGHRGHGEVLRAGQLSDPAPTPPGTSPSTGATRRPRRSRRRRPATSARCRTRMRSSATIP